MLPAKEVLVPMLCVNFLLILESFREWDMRGWKYIWNMETGAAVSVNCVTINLQSIWTTRGRKKEDKRRKSIKLFSIQMVTSWQNGVVSTEKISQKIFTCVCWCESCFSYYYFILLNKIRKCAHKLLTFNHIVLERTVFSALRSHLYGFIFHFHLPVFPLH